MTGLDSEGQRSRSHVGQWFKYVMAKTSKTTLGRRRRSTSSCFDVNTLLILTNDVSTFNRPSEVSKVYSLQIVAIVIVVIYLLK